MIKLKNIKIFDLYIFQLVAIATLFAIVAFIVVWISPETLFNIINRLIYGQITIKEGLFWLFFEIPTVLGKAIPVGLLLGTLFITDMFSRNFELVIFRSIGISFWRMLKPIIILSSILAVFCYFAYNSFIPYSSYKVNEIKSGTDTTIKQWSYLEKDDIGNPKQLIVISNAKDKQLYGINVFQIMPESHNKDKNASMKKIIFAEQGKFIDNKFIIYNVVIYELLESGIYKNILYIDDMTILEGKPAINAEKLYNANGVTPESLSRKRVIEYLKLLKEEHITDEYNVYLNNLFQRFAQALSCIVFAICGLILGWSRPRENRFIGFTIGALIIFSYYLTIPFINMLAEKSILHPIVTAFLPLILISIGMFFYAKHKDL